MALAVIHVKILLKCFVDKVAYEFIGDFQK